jgi:endonuclease-3
MPSEASHVKEWLSLPVTKTPTSHAFVIACLMDRQIKAERAWQIPYELQQRLGHFDMDKLSKIRRSTFGKVMRSPTSLHRYHSMSNLLFDAVQMIAEAYHGRASRIWTGKPSSATVVQRFLEFRGIGPKIATMAANILAREFKVPFGDYYSIDISVDVHTRRVLKRLGLVPEAATNEYIIYTARSFHPEYPGVIDLALYRLGKSICSSRDPRCIECSFLNTCAFALDFH